MKQFYAETKGIKGLKQYNEEVKVWIDDIEDYLKDLKNIHLLDAPLFDTNNDIKISAQIAKVPSHVITYQLFEQGKTLVEISKERGIVYETVIGHLAKFAEKGLLDLEKLIAKEKIKDFEAIHKEHEYETLTEWKNALPKGFEFYEIRVLWNHFNYLRDQKNETEIS